MRSFQVETARVGIYPDAVSMGKAAASPFSAAQSMNSNRPLSGAYAHSLADGWDSGIVMFRSNLIWFSRQGLQPTALQH
jgi:hypothetical protein